MEGEWEGLCLGVVRFSDRICTYITSLKGSVDDVCLFLDELNTTDTLVRSTLPMSRFTPITDMVVPPPMGLLRGITMVTMGVAYLYFAALRGNSPLRLRVTPTSPSDVAGGTTHVRLPSVLEYIGHSLPPIRIVTFSLG